ncbi:MAG: excalibur calcium-binding domain-containing protein [Chloroflexi bacterium]|nr:excalibur calcium-binding domain-containing protein [Chloroflexota bacterium]
MSTISDIETPIPPGASSSSVQVFASSTSIRPTETSIPPTFTSVPPSDTPIPPTQTPLPPTATAVPPSSTPTTSSAYSVNRYASPQTRYTHGTVNLREGPGTSYDLLGSVPINAVLQVVGKSGDWYLIRHSGREVFIAGWLTFDTPLQQPAQQTGFSCSPRKNCSQMSSCAEARFYLTQCQRGDLDNDSDGTPCESICGAASVQQPAQQPAAPQQPAQQPTARVQQPAAPQEPSYSCNCSKTCSTMSSCQEAYFQLNNCGCRRRDNDGDGVPCEKICR